MCSGKSFFAAAICAASCVCRGTEFRLSDEGKAKIEKETVALVSRLYSYCNKREPGKLVESVYGKATYQNIFKSDCNTLYRILTADFPRYLDYGSDKFETFSEFKRCKTSRVEGWQVTRCFLFSAFNFWVHASARTSCYGLGIFNAAAVSWVPFFKSRPKFVSEHGFFDSHVFFKEEPFFNQIFETVWTEIEKWFNSDRDKPASGADSADLYFRPAWWMNRNLRSFDREEMENILVVGSPEGGLTLDGEVKRKILDRIKAYLLEYLYNSETWPGEKREWLSTSCFKTDCAVLFRFFTREVPERFFSPQKFGEKSPEEQRSFVERGEDGERFNSVKKCPI